MSEPLAALWGQVGGALRGAPGLCVNRASSVLRCGGPAPRSNLTEQEIGEYLLAMVTVILVMGLAFWMGFGGPHG